ncbi:MAG: cupin-like domain-containing protein, partial [Myxococcales bacterium]
YGADRVSLHQFTRRNAVTATLAGFVEWMARPEGSALAQHGAEPFPSSSLYLAWDGSMLRRHPELLADFDFDGLFPGGLRRIQLGFWMGPAGAHTPLHYDIDAPNLHAAISGRKRFVLFAPEESAHLSPADVYEWTTVFSEIDLRAPDVQRHPGLARANGYEAVLAPGDVLFIPVRWWHAAWCLESCISLNGWRFGPRLALSPNLWNAAAAALLHRAGVYARDRCTCCGHGDLRRHLGWIAD